MTNSRTRINKKKWGLGVQVSALFFPTLTVSLGSRIRSPFLVLFLSPNCLFLIEGFEQTLARVVSRPFGLRCLFTAVDYETYETPRPNENKEVNKQESLRHRCTVSKNAILDGPNGFTDQAEILSK